MIWYKHFLDAYDRDTSELTLLQHGAYRRLLDAYYQREGPLPSKLSTIYRMVRASSGADQRAVGVVLSRFFNLHEGLYFNNRAQEEIVKYQAQCSANRQRIGGRFGGRIATEVRSKNKNGVEVDLSLLHGEVPTLIKKPRSAEPDPAQIEKNRAISEACRDGNTELAKRIRDGH